VTPVTRPQRRRHGPPGRPLAVRARPLAGGGARPHGEPGRPRVAHRDGPAVRARGAL